MARFDNQANLFLKKWYKRWWAIAIFCFIGLLILFSPFYIYQIISVYRQMKAGIYISSVELENQSPYSMDYIIDPMSPWKGNAAAQIQIVEFGDFNCSRTLQAFGTMRELEAKYHDKIKFYWRNYPVMNENSIEFAKAGICAQRQGKFWLFHDRLFQLYGKISSENLVEMAQSLGLDASKYKSCFDNPMTLAQLKKDYFAAKQGEVKGTPTFFINGYKLQGAVPLASWIEVVEKFISIYEKDIGN